jgi:prepilin-type N-terminal cleavage/methylation domain-containing protein
LTGGERTVKTNRYAGYTLVEILITLAIIAILAALLFPAFSRVREKGRRATCTSNLKQLYSGIQNYVQDNDSYYPRQANWEFAIDPYIKNQGVFFCPSQKYHGQHHDHPSDYAFNSTRFNFIADSKAKGANDVTIVLPTHFVLLEDTGDVDNGAPYQN